MVENNKIARFESIDRWLERNGKFLVITSFLIVTLTAIADLTGILSAWGIETSPGVTMGLQVAVIVLMFAFLVQSPEIVGTLLLILAVYIGIRGFLFLYEGGFSYQQITSDFYANISTELASIAITVLIIDVINRRHTKQQELADLKWQMGSRDRVLALEAVRKLRGKKWLIDGTLKGIDLRGANLQGAGLYKANLEGADLRKVKLHDAYLVGANLRNANVTIEQLATARNLKYAAMPDGRKYEEWEPIIPVKEPKETVVSNQPQSPSNISNEKVRLLFAGASIALFTSLLTAWIQNQWFKK
ncbi:hypothetical protein MNBD_CHLOROFLEXI01-3306 [hydrothermal vent metagenome]|uniref:Pentapeptide repeat family protein n=1 Tax=hydrothermal vent metagenome TaxID=652676 RepID=A0A3B0VJ86_9ZZZZ